MPKSVLLIIILLISLSVAASATPQAPDKLIHKGKTYMLFANPLESFYRTGQSKPRFQIAPRTWSSGNERGYVATWEVKDENLYLIGIDSWICESLGSDNCKKADLKEMFGERYHDGRVKADWFSGELRMPEGKVLQYVHLGYDSLFERDTFLTVEAGKITDEKVIDNTQKPIPSPQELQKQEYERMKKRGEVP
jgi:hypothetical protein